MLNVIDLWIPILISVVLVFVASSIIHMVLKTHHKDFERLPGEDQILDAMRAQGVSPGAYMFPYCSDMKEMGSDETKAKFDRGPVGMMTVLPNGMPNMGKSLGLWVVYLLLVSIFVAYIGAAALPPGVEYLTVFRTVGAAAFLPFVIANMPASIWYGQPWPTTIRFGIDGVVYSLLVAGTFAGFWPGG
ncbi:MAG: hypothetical protein RQ847_04675 [Wenzhouxiangellaceae bacterium]|nr:hypothetical protein [Wenzhouxiangellaceae bacterium]